MTDQIVSVKGNSVNVSPESSQITPTPAFMAQTLLNLTTVKIVSTTIAVSNNTRMNTTIYSNGMNSLNISLAPSSSGFMMPRSLKLTNIHSGVTALATFSGHQMKTTQKLPSTNSTVFSMEENSVTLSLDASSISPTSLLTDFFIMQTSSRSINMQSSVRQIANSNSHEMNKIIDSWSISSTVTSAEGTSFNLASEAASVPPTSLLTTVAVLTSSNWINIVSKVTLITSSRSQEMIKTTHLPIMNSTFVPSQTPTTCTNCLKSTDKDFKYMMMGIGIGAAFLFFIVLFTVAVCMKRRESRKPARHYGGLSPEEAEDNFFRSKDSIFSSSTLQLRGGLNNDALEMEGTYLHFIDFVFVSLLLRFHSNIITELRKCMCIT